MSNLDQHRRLAEDLVAAYNTSDPDAVERLNKVFHSSINADQIRHFVRDRLIFLPGYEQHTFDVLTLADAQQLFASIYGLRTGRTSNVRATNHRAIYDGLQSS